MIELQKCEKLFIDFDGVIVDSNKFKELAIEKSIYKFMGINKTSIEAINYFNINAGVSRVKKLSLFYDDAIVKKILDSYSEQCRVFSSGNTNKRIKKAFFNIKKKNQNHIKIFILSGGEKKRFIYFLRKIYFFIF